jgi:hypothetical protein
MDSQYEQREGYHTLKWQSMLAIPKLWRVETMAGLRSDHENPIDCYLQA